MSKTRHDKKALRETSSATGDDTLRVMRKAKNRVAAAASRDRNNSYITTLETAYGSLKTDCRAYQERLEDLACAVHANMQLLKILVSELDNVVKSKRLP